MAKSVYNIIVKRLKATYKTMLNSNGESGHPCLVPDHRENAFNFSPLIWDSPGKNTGVGCHFLLQCMKVKSESEITQSCPILCDPMNRSTPGLPVHHQGPESTQTHGCCVDDAIQPSHPLLSPSPPALNLSQHQGLFQRVNSLHQVAKVFEFQLQHQSLQ